MPESGSLLSNCLYFTANSLARVVTRMAEEAFMPVGLSPSQAFALMLAGETPGVGPSELAARLRLAPSTVTRLVDSLIAKGFLEKTAQGKAVSIRPTSKGRALGPEMAAAWKSLYHAYSHILGEDAGRDLTRVIHLASEKLENA